MQTDASFFGWGFIVLHIGTANMQEHPIAIELGRFRGAQLNFQSPSEGKRGDFIGNHCTIRKQGKKAVRDAEAMGVAGPTESSTAGIQGGMGKELAGAEDELDDSFPRSPQAG